MNKIGNKRCKIFHIFRFCDKMLVKKKVGKRIERIK